MLEQFLPIVFQFLQIVIFPAVAYYLIAWLRKKGIIETIKAKELIVADAVWFVEQLYGHLDGSEKYLKALEWASNRLDEYGLKVTPDELNGLIEAFVAQLKAEWPED